MTLASRPRRRTVARAAAAVPGGLTGDSRGAGTQQACYPRRGLREARDATVAHREGAWTPNWRRAADRQPRDTSVAPPGAVTLPAGVGVSPPRRGRGHGRRRPRLPARPRARDLGRERREPLPSAVVSNGHGHDHGHDHARPHPTRRRADADARWLRVALALIAASWSSRSSAGLLAGSLALLSDAGHMLTDAAAIGLALVADPARRAGPPAARCTFGLRRAEILSAQANGVTLLVLAAVLRRRGGPPPVRPARGRGRPRARRRARRHRRQHRRAWALARADRRSLNVEGALQHILTDLYAFIGTAVAGVVILVDRLGPRRLDRLAVRRRR